MKELYFRRVESRSTPEALNNTQPTCNNLATVTPAPGLSGHNVGQQTKIA